MPVKGGNGIPAYQRIQGAIRKTIENGSLRPGDAVPSERELAKIHDVSLMTARHALATLNAEASSSAGAESAPSSPRLRFTSTN